MIGNSGLFENTKGAEEHEKNVVYIREIVEEFAVWEGTRTGGRQGRLLEAWKIITNGA